MCWCHVQTGHSQLRRYKAKKQMVISEEPGTEAVKPKSQLLEFWLVREYCDRGSLSVSLLITECTMTMWSMHCYTFEWGRRSRFLPDILIVMTVAVSYNTSESTSSRQTNTHAARSVCDAMLKCSVMLSLYCSVNAHTWY